MKFGIGIIALGLVAVSLVSGELSAQVRSSVKDFPALDSLSGVPEDFVKTPHAAAFETIIAYQEINESIARFESRRSHDAQDAEFAFKLIAEPCLMYEVIHDLAYEKGAVYARYPKANFSSRASKADQYYAQAFHKAEAIMSEVNDMAVEFECAIVPNNKCCNISGALDKCDDSTKFCEMTGSVDNCTSTSQNC